MFIVAPGVLEALVGGERIMVTSPTYNKLQSLPIYQSASSNVTVPNTNGNVHKFLLANTVVLWKQIKTKNRRETILACNLLFQFNDEQCAILIVL